MKAINYGAVMLMFGLTSFAQNTKTAKSEIRNLITTFSSAVETRNIEDLDSLLNENFRVVANRFPSDDKTTILTKETYLTLLKAGKIGGEKRTIRIKSIAVSDHIANAKIEFESDQSIFTTYQTFILTSSKVWQLISDMPIVIKKE